LPFAALSASYFAHIGFFNPYLPLWLKDMGLSLLTISVLTAVQATTRLFAPYAWGALSDRTGERVKLLRMGAGVAFAASCLLFIDWGPVGLGLVLLLMFTHTSAMMPMSEAAMAHLVSQGGAFDTKRYGRVRLWGSLGFLVTVFAAGAWFEAFGMQDDAEYEFNIGGQKRFAKESKHFGLPEFQDKRKKHLGRSESYDGDARMTQIGDLGLKPDQVSGYCFDFEQDWYYFVWFTKIDKAIETVVDPRVTRKEGKAPPQHSPESKFGQQSS
jgi:hypothetical protein